MKNGSDVFAHLKKRHFFPADHLLKEIALTLAAQARFIQFFSLLKSIRPFRKTFLVS